MSQDTEGLLKSVAQTAAESLAKEGESTLVLAAKLGLFRQSTSVTEGMSAAGKGKPDQIGIWERREQGGKVSFVRSDRFLDQVHRWADVDVIPPKGRKKRVVYLGESVARGFLFDPFYTPAQVLQDLLAQHVPEGVEVVDLAAHDLEAAELLQMLKQISLLEPDAMVIFAGNNWAPGAIALTAHDTVRRQYAAASLRTSGVAGLKDFLEEEFLAIIARELQMLPTLVQSMGLPTVVVIPEFNLLDWRNESTAAVPWMRADHNQNWWLYFEAAQLALQQGKFAQAAETAERILELDEGTTSQGLSILGECKKVLGLRQEARQYFEKARDARIWDPMNISPRCYSTIQEGLRRLAGDQLAVVDLPEVFQAWTGDVLPDRRLFLDYCHLTAEGIQVAMATTAEALVRLLGGSNVSRDDLLSSADYSPSADVESMAHFGAAIHNAHWGQDQEVVLHHCMVAAKSSTRTSRIMAHYVDIQGRRVPPFFADKAQAFFEEGGELLHRFIMGSSRAVLFDELLLNAVVESLDRVGIDVRKQLASIREEEWGITVARPADLTTDEYKPSFANRSWNRNAHRFYRALTPVTRFSMVCRSEHAVKLELTCRRPIRFMKPNQSCRITFNGCDLDEFELPETWKTLRFTAPSHFVRRGVNSIEIYWPIGSWAGDEALDWAAKELEAGRVVDLAPAFGEIYTLYAAVI